ncbi:MAG: O-antigen ligase family protein, partial [Desulfobacteraceae bacterium]|nr:O-antigen ligase family protein [Desulfobacteraceae bacterium]
EASGCHSRSLLLGVQQFAFLALLVFAPLARGATARWTFCVALWLALVAVCAMLARRLWSGERLLPETPLDLPLALLLVVAGISSLGSIYRDATLWGLLRLFLYIAAFYLAFEMTEERERTRRLLQVLVGMGIFVSLVGLIEHGDGSLSVFRETGIFPGLNGTFVNYNHLAGFLAMIFTLALGVVLHRTTESIMAWGCALLLVLVALCLSQSRGAWIGSLLAVGFVLVCSMLKRKVSKLKIGVFAFGLLVIVGLTILGSNPVMSRLQSLKNPADTSFSQRVAVWRGCADLVKKSPLLGTGLGTFPWSFASVRPPGITLRWREAHNDWLQIVSEMGLPVLIPLLWGLIVVFSRGLRGFLAASSRLKTGAVLGALGGIAGILVHSLSDFNIQITSNGIVFACLVGLAMGRYSWEKNRNLQVQ